MYIELALLAYFIDALVGEFTSIKHPIRTMGAYITWFQKNFYQYTVKRGTILTISLLLLVALIAYALTLFSQNSLFLALIASTGIASKMLHDSVLDVIKQPDSIQYLVSRDTKQLTASDINKAAIESYAENLSDGVIAPLLYLLLFGIVGLFIYKAINTLDSMVGYRTRQYEKFGKFSAKLDDVANYIPARITLVLIALLMLNKRALIDGILHGGQHNSPNAGYPITAMAVACHVSLGGPTKYFGQLLHKPYFGHGTKQINSSHIRTALSFKTRMDLLMIFMAVVWLIV